MKNDEDSLLASLSKAIKIIFVGLFVILMIRFIDGNDHRMGYIEFTDNGMVYKNQFLNIGQ